MSADQTRAVFERQLAALNSQIADKNALLTLTDDAGEIFLAVDAEKMGPDFMSLYEGMTQTGYSQGWL